MKKSTIACQSLNLLPALTETKRESRHELVQGSCLGALGKLTSKSKEENYSREHSREREEKLSKKISQHSFEDIYLHSTGQYFEAPPKIKRKQQFVNDSNEHISESQVSKLFPLIARSVSKVDSRNFADSVATELKEPDDIVQFEAEVVSGNGRATPNPTKHQGII